MPLFLYNDIIETGDIKMEKIKYIMCDLDGTLLKEDKTVSLRTKNAIHEARKKGIQFGISTGRPLSAVKRKVVEWGIEDLCDFLIGMNGGEILDCNTKQLERMYLLESTNIKRIIEHYKDWDVNFILYDGDKIIYRKEDFAVDYLSKINGLTHSCTSFENAIQKDYPKMILACEKERMEEVKRHASLLNDSMFRSVQSQPFLLEFLDQRVSKSKGIEKAVSWYGGRLEEVLVFGDTSNDNEMIKDCGIGVCMANGTEDTKALADAITASNEEDGVALYIEKYILGKEYMKWDELYTKEHQPTLKEVEDFIEMDLWKTFTTYMQQNFHAKPSLQYSCCSMQKGWNLKYKKGSKNLCTLYPMNRYFIVLVTISSNLKQKVEANLDQMGEHMNEVYKKTPYTNGSKWMMIEVRKEEDYQSLIKLLHLKY